MKLTQYLNPIARLGKKEYSILFPFTVVLGTCILSEILSYGILHNPMAVGVYAIFLFVVLIIYFAFRDGLRGGITATVLTVGYYFYIIFTRHYTGTQLYAGIETTITLGLVYLSLAGIIGWLKETIDVLIEREADERRRLQAIIEQLPVGVVITDSTGHVIRSNKKIDSIIGMKFPIGFPVGQQVLLETKQNGKILGPSQGPLAHTLATGKPIVGKEMSIMRKDGKQVYLEVSSSAIHNREGKMIAAVSISYDITQQKELENRKDDFVNIASHELKTPITSMKLYIELLMRRLAKTEDERTVKILSSIQFQTEKLQELVSDLLDVSRIRTGKLIFTKEKFAIDELITETVQGLQETTTRHKISFVASKRVIIYGDRFRIYQVVTNLLTNAIKYTPQGGPITIGLKSIDGKVVISVKDTGVGVSKEQRRKIFERLYQVSDPKDKTFPGLGMGLYISREIVKRHRGNLWVESEGSRKGLTAGRQGSTFFFSLPVKQ